MLAVSNRKILAATLSIICIVLAISYYFVASGALSRLDAFVLDRFFSLRGSLDPGGDILIVSLDRRSAQVLGKRGTAWKRVDFARMIRMLSDAGADLIAIDYLFAVPDPESGQDAALSGAMRDSASVILASLISERDRTVPLDLFRQQEVGEGFVNIMPDPDGVVRKIPWPSFRLKGAGEMAVDLPFSLAVALSRIYPNGDFRTDLTHSDHAAFGDLRVPYAGRKASEGFFINFAGPSLHFPVLPAHRVLEQDFDPAQIRGKIVLIGNMNPLVHDYYPVPFEGEMVSMYGVEIHANAIRTLLTRSFLAPLSKAATALLLTLVALVAIWLAVGWKRNAFLVSAALLALLLLMVGGCYAAFRAGHVVAGAPLYLCVGLIGAAGLIGRQAEESTQKRYIMQLFGRYVSPTVVQELIRNRDLVRLGGRKERLTVFFSDIRGFTSMSEKMPPEEVSALLNDYFSRMTRIVFAHGGTLDKFMGDAVMAFFGNPLYFPGHAKEAVAMALDMKEEMERLLKEREAAGQEASFGIGMGINTGEVVVGNLGSNEFVDYTVIGDDVNLACRLESVAGKGQILISASTYEEIKDDFEVVRLEPVTVKGKSRPVDVYEVLRRRVRKA